LFFKPIMLFISRLINLTGLVECYRG
jgi:hypothetical protein